MPKRIVMRRRDQVTFAAALHNNISFLQRKGLSNADLRLWAMENCPAAHISRDGIKTVCDIAEALGLIDHKPGNKGWPIKRKTRKKLPKGTVSNIERFNKAEALRRALNNANPQKLDALLAMDPARRDALLELAKDPEKLDLVLELTQDSPAMSGEKLIESYQDMGKTLPKPETIEPSDAPSAEQPKPKSKPQPEKV